MGKQVHQRWIVDGGDAVADALDAQKFDGFTDFFWAADFASVDEAMEAGGRCGLVDGKKILRGDAELIAADTEGDDLSGRAILRRLDDAQRGVGAELANGIENPPKRQTARFEIFGGAEDGCEVFLRRLIAEKHDAYGEGDFRVDDMVRKELFAKVVRDESVIGGIAQERSDSLESVEKTEKFSVVVAAANVIFCRRDTVARGQRTDRSGLNSAFEV